MTDPAPPGVSVAPQPAVVKPSLSIRLPVDEMGDYVGAGVDVIIREGVCRDCGRLLYQALTVVDRAKDERVIADTWHPYTILSGEETVRFDGTTVLSLPGPCAGRVKDDGRPDPSAFVLGVPLVPEHWDGSAMDLPCYICGDPKNHWAGDEPYLCHTELTRAAADRLRELVGFDQVDHERRRDDRV